MKSIPTPLVSVVIPTYNDATFLERALRSVLGQTHDNLEIIVVDNTSTDNTIEVVHGIADPRVRLLTIRNHGVIAASRNMGVRAAIGDWIAFLDSDDLWDRDKIQVCLQMAGPQVQLVHHELRTERQHRTILRRSVVGCRQLKKPMIVDLLVRGNAIATSSVVVRKAVLQEVGLMNESREMIGSEDYNTWLRIARATDGFLYIPRPLGSYTIHDRANSRKDMSSFTQAASKQFLEILTPEQQLRASARIAYSRGRFAFEKSDYRAARRDLVVSARWGDWELRLKSLWMICASSVLTK